jgi:hypothetical protein
MANSSQAFDPDAYLSGGGGFDPDAYLKGGPSTSDKVLNFVGDVGTEVSVSMAGQALGAATGPGYFAIAPAAGLYGNYLKQQREIERGERKDYSLGEGLASAFLNFLPGGTVLKAAGKEVAKRTGEEVAQAVVKRGIMGVGASTTAGQIETLVEEKRFPTYDEYLSMAKSGAITGGVAGLAEAKIAGADLSEAGKKFWNRLAGKNEQEIGSVINQVKESGTKAERQAASEVVDVIGQELGIVKPFDKPIQQSVETFGGSMGGRAEASARSLLGDETVNMALREAQLLSAPEQAALRQREVVEQARIQAEREAQAAARAVPGGFGGEAATAGSRPAPASQIQGVEVAPRPMGGFGGSGAEGTPVSYPRSAAESAETFQSAVSAEAPYSAAVFERAIDEGRTQAGAMGLRSRLAAEQQAAIRAGDYQKARELESLASSIESRRLTGPESVPSEQVLASTMVKPAGKVGRGMGSDLPTTEDIIQEFQNVPGVGGRAGARRMGLASVGGAGALMLKDEAQAAEPAIGAVEVEHPYLGTLKYNRDWSAEDIQNDVNKREVEYAKIQAASPQLQLREKFENAKTHAEKLSVLQEFGPMGAAMGMRMAGGAAAGVAPPMVRPFIGMGTEAAALAVEGQPITPGKMGRAAAEYTVAGASGQLAKNALKFMGINVVGEQIEEFIDRGGLISLDAAAKKAAEGGAQAVVMKAVDKGKLAGLQRKAIEGDSELIKTLNMVNEAGLIGDPLAFSKTTGRKAAMKLAGGSDEYQKYASIINEPKILNMAKQDIGIEGALNRENFIARRLELGQAYSDVANISGTAREAVNQWKLANDAARDAYRKAASKADTEALQAARSYRDQANRWFDTIISEAERTGNESLVRNLKNSQRLIAKTYAVEAATNTATGRIDNAKAWGLMWDDGMKFDGNMETLARLARTMPEVMADTSKIGIGKGVPQGKMAAAFAATEIPSMTRSAIGSRAGQAMSFLPRYQEGTPDAAARAARFLTGDVADRMQEQRPVPYR